MERGDRQHGGVIAVEAVKIIIHIRTQ